MSKHDSAEKEATKNPYDVAHTCRCFAWSEGECACGGYVDRGKVRAWQQGYDAAVRDLTTRAESESAGEAQRIRGTAPGQEQLR